MCRPILADSDGIVRENVDDRKLHQSAQTNRRAHVVAEDQEARSECTYLGKRHSVGYRPHGMLADAEVQIAAAIARSFKIAGAVEGETSLGGWRKIGRTADHARHTVCNGVLHARAAVPSSPA